MKLIDTQIEVNEDFIPNSNITYDIYFDGKLNFEARLSDPNNERRMVSFEDAPKVINYVMDKPIEEFTDEEKEQILAYRGLTLKDGFEAADVFMEKSFIKIKDLFEHYEELPSEVQNILESFNEAENTYEECGKLVDKLEAIGYTCEYYLDAEPFNLRKL